MKLKSYLRGLGIGIVITTIVLIVAFRNRNQQMSDAEIIARAHELGMIETSMFGNDNKESTNIEEQQNETTEGIVETAGTDFIENITEDTESQESEALTENVTEKEIERETETASESTSGYETATEEKVTQISYAEGEEIFVVFENISTATQATTMLFEAGVIDSEESFNVYLAVNGLTTRIREGTFSFKKGMTFDEIAAVITR